jgi:RNA polymerase sigma-70 factor, ECF subfamily
MTGTLGFHCWRQSTNVREFVTERNMEHETMNALQEQTIPASVNVGSAKPAEPRLPGLSAQRRRVTKCNSLTIDERRSEKILTSVAPITSEATSEAEAIERAQRGDKAMFEFLYRLHSGRVYAVCLRMVGDTTEAEDLTQEVFLLVFRKIHTFRGESAFSTWLHRLAVNRVLMHLRKKLLPAVSMEGPADPEKESGSLSIDPGAPDLLMEGTLDRINLARCIKQLPVGYRTAFVLHDVQGYKHSEIAGILGCSVGGSKSQLHKARTRLRELLHELQRGKARDVRIAAD